MLTNSVKCRENQQQNMKKSDNNWSKNHWLIHLLL